MKRKFLLTLISMTIIAAKPSFSQISTDEKPYSFSLPAALSKKAEIPALSLPAPDLKRLAREDAAEAEQGIPPRFGNPYQVNLNLDNAGTWTDLPDGNRLWQLKISSEKALSINLLYDKFRLPAGGKLFLYNETTGQSIGAFTDRNNKGKNNETAGFATGLIYGDKITLEYLEPAAVKGQAVISISYVVQGYRYIKLPGDKSGFGQSGACNVNINCPEGSTWQQEKNAVALILVGGTRWCTGSLVNNTAANRVPYLLTANHCLSGLDALGNTNAQNWSFYWNYESPNCTNGASEPPILSTSGATLVANNSASDFALFRLTEDPLNRTGVTPYYLGWDRSGNGIAGVGIHHPNGDVKKISTYTQISATAYGSTGGNPDHWRVTWNQTQTNRGITEGGSSGSALINNQRRLIGQLHGGASSCSNLNGADWYGRFSLSWGNSTDSRRRLSDWLDPANTSATTVDGLTACQARGTIYGLSDICGSGTFEIGNATPGISISWSVSGPFQISGPATGTNITVTANGSGSGTVTAVLTHPCGATTTLTRPVTNKLQTPAGISGIEPGQTFCLNASYGVQVNQVNGATSYQWTCSAGISSGQGSTGISFRTGNRPSPLLISVTAVNACGSSDPYYVDAEIIDCSGGGNNLFIAFPNPTSNSITISRNTDLVISDHAKVAGNVQVKLINEKGVQVRAGQISQEQPSVQFDTQRLPEGTYYLHLTEGKKVTKKQVIVKH